MKRSGSIRLFITAVCLAAVAVAFKFAAHGIWDQVGILATLVLGTAAAAAWPVRLPNVRVQFTVNHPIILCSLAMLGPGPAILVASAGVVGATLKVRHKATAVRLVFNLGAQILAAGLAGMTFMLAGGQAGEPLRELLIPLLAATTVLFLADNGLVAMVVAMDQDRPFWTVWNDSFRWSAVSYFTGMSFASAIMLAYESLGVMGFALGIAPAWLLISFFRIQKRWQAEHLHRMEQVEQLNRVLEWKVKDRTRELQAALGSLEETNSKLVGANEALTEASKAKSEFLANVSHELRTPLNAVIGFSEVLSAQETEGLSGRQLDFLKAIHDGGDHLLSLINDILDLSKIESGRMPLNLDVVEAVPIVSEVVAMLQGQAEKTELDLVAECDDGISPVSVDPRLFREVLLNLVSNAIKFTPEGGSIRVLARMEDSDLVVQVVDNGIGLAEGDQARVFEQFFQVDGTYTRKFRGTGLGLGLVRRMVEMHGGTVAVHSVLGEGATFSCRFPDCRVDVPRELPPSDFGVNVSGNEGDPLSSDSQDPAPMVKAGQRTILVVDPDPLNRRLAVNALKTRDYRVLEASASAAALQFLRVQRVDLVLVALDLADADAYALAQNILNEPAARGVALVALAGTEMTDPAVIRKSGFDGLIATPVQINKLPSQVRTYLERKEHVA
ncbi:MAG: hybrid sensor histidine kinase/response regulator [Acidobacteria bacterium]|uniref:histidine kinase n=1 Tax=Candidatus Polarisedimenticola svalbardensis TaxID=2886004 RepID=A0A8J7CCH6_9BACT|nr:hybrid sensor histidine kinase/response regulator [Candidatus Polarisedimenticola svalbardensis]